MCVADCGVDLFVYCSFYVGSLVNEFNYNVYICFCANFSEFIKLSHEGQVVSIRLSGNTQQMLILWVVG